MSNSHDVRRFYVIDGVTYRESGWLGCQLESIEWRKPDASYPERRRILLGRAFEPFTIKRDGLRWRITWCLCAIANIHLDRANAMIHEFLKELRG